MDEIHNPLGIVVNVHKTSRRQYGDFIVNNAVSKSKRFSVFDRG